MNFINRAVKNVIRRPSKSVLLILTFFLIGNLVIIGLGVSSASESAKILTRQKMRAVVTYKLDYDKISEYTMNITDEDEMQEFYKNYPRIKLSDVSSFFDDERVKTANAVSNATWYTDGAQSLDFVHLNNRVEENINNSGTSCWIAEDGSQQCETFMEPYFMIKGNMFDDMIEFADGEYQITSGRFYSKQEISDASFVCLVSENFAQTNGISVGDTINLAVNYLSSYMSQFDLTQEELENGFEVIGIFSHNNPVTPGSSNYDYCYPYENPDNMIFMPSTSMYAAQLPYLQKQYEYYAKTNPDEDYYADENNMPTMENMESQLYMDNVTLLLNDPLNVEQFVLDHQDSISQFTSLDANNDQFNTLAKPLDTLSMYANFIVWLVVINAIVIITLVTALTLKTREYEIGVLLSIGASKLKVIGQFFIELAIVAVIGFTLSVVSGSLIAKKIGNTVLEYQISTSDIEQENDYRDYYVNPYNNNYSTEITIDDLINEYEVKISPLIIGEIFVLGLGIVLISVIIPSFMIMRYNPKKILMNQN